METPTAQRRLVKSPPELWAEISDETTLSRHLAEFGEIRITRAEPETTVAWEGDRASGTVEIEPAGWGTKVVLTAVPVTDQDAEEPIAGIEPVAQSTPEPVTEAEPGPEIVATPASSVASEPTRRRGFFARWLRKRDRAPVAEIPAPPAPSPDPAPPTPGPDPQPPVPAPDPSPPDPGPPAPGPMPLPDPPAPPTQPDPAPPTIEAPLDPERTVAILTEVLDDLGAAHHRPFSRD